MSEFYITVIVIFSCVTLVAIAYLVIKDENRNIPPATKALGDAAGKIIPRVIKSRK